MYEIVGHYSNCNICGAGNDMIFFWKPEDTDSRMWKAGYRSNCHGEDYVTFTTGKAALEWLAQRKWLLATRDSKRRWIQMERDLRKHPNWEVAVSGGTFPAGGDVGADDSLNIISFAADPRPEPVVSGMGSGARLGHSVTEMIVDEVPNWVELTSMRISDFQAGVERVGRAANEFRLSLSPDSAVR